MNFVGMCLGVSGGMSQQSLNGKWLIDWCQGEGNLMNLGLHHNSPFYNRRLINIRLVNATMKTLFTLKKAEKKIFSVKWNWCNLWSDWKWSMNCNFGLLIQLSVNCKNFPKKNLLKFQ